MNEQHFPDASTARKATKAVIRAKRTKEQQRFDRLLTVAYNAIRDAEKDGKFYAQFTAVPDDIKAFLEEKGYKFRCIGHSGEQEMSWDNPQG
jgi:hypothetical protein